MQIIGKTLGQYRILEKIGQGGMATVFKAYQPNLDRFVAVKTLAPQHAQTPGFKERFLREAKAVAMLSHPNILQVYDVGMENDISYIVMKYISGHSMREILGPQMDLGKACRFIDQIAGALDHAHDNGIIHRDIKSANLLVEGEWVLIADFGIAKIVEGSTALTSAGETMGTPAYMSPEQASGKPVNHYTDIYSLGIVLYEMLTGQVPFKGETPYGVMFKHVNDPLPLPRIHRPDLPECAERIILKALAKVPEHRYERAGQLAEALRSCAEIAAREPEAQPAPGLTPRPLHVQDTPPAQPEIEDSPPLASPPSQASSPLTGDNAIWRRPANASSSKVLFLMAGVLLTVLGIAGAVLYFWPSFTSRTPPIPPKQASLRVESNPPAATIYVDEVIKGKTPLHLELPVGEYALRMTLSGHQEWKDRIRIEEAREYPVEVDLKKEANLAWLKIDSKPVGAEVYVNDQLQGKSPLKSGLPLGGYTIRVKMPGYREFERVVQLDEPREVHLILDLVRSEMVPPVADQTQAHFEKGRELFGSKNYQEALEQFKLAAAQGQAESQNEVGYMIMHGLGVEKDLKDAAMWFRKAAAQGHAGSQNNLGILYLRGGLGIKQDDREAFSWFRMAAEQGDRDGQFYLANMYRYGRGMETGRKPDLEQAADLYRKAAKQGHEGAVKALKALGK